MSFTTEKGAQADSGIKRGCGHRAAGGIYLECGTSPFGVDPSVFVVDPPEPFEMENKRGQDVRLRRESGTHHVFDWVGASGYPCAADIVHEVSDHGASRRVSQNLPFEKLTDDSRLLLVHPRAVAASPQMLRQLESMLNLRAYNTWKERCWHYRRSNGSDHHLNATDAEVPCSRWWYFDAGWDEQFAANQIASLDALSAHEQDRVAPFTVGEDAPTLAPVGNRTIGDTTYMTFGGPRVHNERGPVNPGMDPGIVMSLPITNITVIEAPDGSHEEIADQVRERTETPVSISPD